jgi:hypothetical protein
MRKKRKPPSQEVNKLQDIDPSTIDFSDPTQALLFFIFLMMASVIGKLDVITERLGELEISSSAGSPTELFIAGVLIGIMAVGAGFCLHWVYQKERRGETEEIDLGTREGDDDARA